MIISTLIKEVESIVNLGGYIPNLVESIWVKSTTININADLSWTDVMVESSAVLTHWPHSVTLLPLILKSNSIASLKKRNLI